MKVKIFDWKYAVLNATIIGLFKNTGRRVELCKHVSCGYVPHSEKRCYEGPNRPMALPSQNAPYYTHYKARYDEQQLHIAAGCRDSWCTKKWGVEVEDKKATCKRTYFKPYSEQELANPETKAEIMAINMDVASDSYHGNYHNLVVVYDLVNDKWYNDEWWTETKSNNLAPAQNPIEGVKPSDVHGMEEVIQKAKELL